MPYTTNDPSMKRQNRMQKSVLALAAAGLAANSLMIVQAAQAPDAPVYRPIPGACTARALLGTSVKTGTTGKIEKTKKEKKKEAEQTASPKADPKKVAEIKNREHAAYAAGAQETERASAPSVLSGTETRTVSSLDALSDAVDPQAARTAAANTEATRPAAAAAWDGTRLTSQAGRIMGPSGQETYYNLPMEQLVQMLRSLGFSEAEYPYHVRADGVRMLGDYVMVAADLSLRPRGSLIMTSLGVGIVCDTGSFALSDPTQLDIAVDW